MTRVVRYGAYGFAALALLLVAAAFIVPRLLDQPRMAAEIQAKLSSALKGEVRWEEFSVRLLPAPHGTLRGLHVETAAATLTAQRVDLALRLWPLFFGRAEIASLELSRPALSLTIVPGAAVPQEAQLAPTQDPLQAYRSTMTALVEALQEFAPDTVVAVEDAGVKLSIEGVPPLEVSKLALRARTSADGVALDASASSPYWTAMKLAGRIRYADLSSTAELRLTRVQGKAWLDWLLSSAGVGVSIPEVDLNVRFRGDAGKALQAEVDGGAKALTVTRGAQRFVASPIALQARVALDASELSVAIDKLGAGATSLAGGTLRYHLKDDALRGDVGFHLDLAQAMGYAALERIESARGSLSGRISPTLAGKEWRVGVTIEQSDAALQVKGLPGPLRVARAAVDIEPGGIRAQNVALGLPAGDVRVGAARYAFKDGAAAADAEFDLDVAQALALARAALPEETLRIVESASGRARGRARGEYTGSTWSASLDLAQSDAQAKLEPLPAPLTLAGAAVRATPKAITVERATAKLLDASVNASATISDFQTSPRIRASVAQATLGPQLVAWVWQTAQIPLGFEPKAPIRIAVPHFAWAPKVPLEVRAEARFDAGPALAVDLAWSPAALELRRAQVKDQRSDVTVALRMRGAHFEGSYDGTLDSRTIGAMLKSAAAPAGAVNGKLRFVFDRRQPGAISVEGRLNGENVDLTWLAGAPATLERMALSSDGTTLRVAEATVSWAGQRATLRGEASRTDGGPVIDAQIDAPSVVVDALLPKEQKPQTGDQTKPNPWPLPVTGRIALRSKLVQYENYKIEPLTAMLTLERNRARLEVTEALVCGLAVPLTLEATPKGYAGRAVIAAQKHRIEDAAQCLAGEKLLITGPLDLRLDVRTQGEAAQLLQNLKGTVTADIRNGTVTKFALLGNILSMQNVVALAKEGGPKLGADAFPFRQFSAKGHFDQGRFVIDEGVFHSNAIGLGANGWISLIDFQTNLTVLVAPLALVDEAVRKLPLLGYVVGGTFTSLPVAVTGDIRDPRVVPLGPRAITSEMMGLLSRTLTLPGKVVPGKD